MKAKLEIMHSCKIAYTRRVGAYGAENKEQMEKLKKWAQENDLLNDEAVILGIAQDDPRYVKPEDCRYDVCIIVPQDYMTHSNEVKIGEIAEGKYAVFEIEHTAEAIAKAWLEIFQEISKLGYKLDEAKLIIERYQMKMIKQHLCEICIPIHS